MKSKTVRKNLAFDMTDPEQKEIVEFLDLCQRDQSRVIAFIVAKYIREVKEKGVDIKDKRTAKVIKMMLGSAEDIKIMAAVSGLSYPSGAENPTEIHTESAQKELKETVSEEKIFARAQKNDEVKEKKDDEGGNLNKSLLDQLDMF